MLRLVSTPMSSSTSSIGPTATPCRSWPRSKAGQAECLADTGTLDELQRVLTYPQLKIDAGNDRSTATAATPASSASYSRRKRRHRCRAARTATTRSFSSSPPVAGPTFLVTKDKALLRVARPDGKLGFRILNPEDASALIQS
jgi:hypothetical protein